MTARPDTAKLEEAGRWFAALRRGVMTLDERRAYSIWRRDPANAAAIAEMEAAWNALSPARRRLAQSQPHHRATSRTRFGRPALVAAMCVVSLGIGLLSYSGDARFWTTLDWTDR